MNALTKIYTGTDNFMDLLLNSDVVVDKSLFIKEFLEGDAKVALITRPRRWGKSLNMRMLEQFLKLELDPTGNPLPEEQQVNRKLFVDGEVVLGFQRGEKKILKSLKISDYGDIITAYQGQYPVISISFKEVKENNYAEVLEALSVELSELFSKYRFHEHTQEGKNC